MEVETKKQTAEELLSETQEDGKPISFHLDILTKWTDSLQQRGYEVDVVGIDKEGKKKFFFILNMDYFTLDVPEHGLIDGSNIKITGIKASV